jgi:ribosomal protein S4
MDGIAMLLGLAPNRLIAQELVRCGGIRINGAVITDQQYSLSFNNMLQVDLNIHNNIKPLYRLTH